MTSAAPEALEPAPDGAGRRLRIALLSYAYAPSLGGIEKVSAMLADGLRGCGHDVRVVTAIADDGREPGPDPVLRRPSPRRLIETLRWSDVVVQSNVSLRLAWPLVLGLVDRPWIVVNHTPVAQPDGRRTYRDRLKLATLGRAHLHSVSRYLRDVTPIRSAVMPNPYDTRTFGPAPSAVRRTRDLLFLGRIVHAKGLDTLIEALAILGQDGYFPRLTIVGEGPERAAVAARAALLGIEGQLEWLGILEGRALAAVLHQTRTLVVPSRPSPPEALPLVPLEAIACGCMVVASDQGGLPESVGPCGLLVQPDNPRALAAALRRAGADEALRHRCIAKALDHLAPFEPAQVISRYEAAIFGALASVSRRPILIARS